MCIFFSRECIYPHCPKLRELESKKWRFTNFVVGRETCGTCLGTHELGDGENH